MSELTERELDVLWALAGFGNDWARPMDCGGRDASYHSRVLYKLANAGLAEMKTRPAIMRAPRLYRITEAGLAALPAPSKEG